MKNVSARLLRRITILWGEGGLRQRQIDNFQSILYFLRRRVVHAKQIREHMTNSRHLLESFLCRILGGIEGKGPPCCIESDVAVTSYTVGELEIALLSGDQAVRSHGDVVLHRSLSPYLRGHLRAPSECLYSEDPSGRLRRLSVILSS